MKNLANSIFLRLLFIALTILCSFCTASKGESNLNLMKEGIIMDEKSSFLIDDFSKAEGASLIGTQWRMFTDRIMGGASKTSSEYKVIE